MTLTAIPNNSDFTFDRWEVVNGSVSFANKSNSITTFTMPRTDVRISGSYKVKSTAGTNSWSGKVPHAAVRLSQYTVTTETACATTEPMPRDCAPQQEKPPHHKQRRPPSPQLESAHSNEDPVQPKVNKINYQK